MSSRKLPILLSDEATGLYRVRWPDGAVSDLANLSRCHDAAREWLERELMTAPGKDSFAVRLKSLKNFSAPSSPVAANSQTLTTGRKIKNNAPAEAHP